MLKRILLAAIVAGAITLFDESLIRQTNAAEPIIKSAKHSRAEGLQRALELKTDEVKKLLTADLNMYVASPFVIAGDMSVEHLRLWHKQTLEPSMIALGNQYFTHKPDAPIVVWLFTDEKPYNKHSLRIYDDKDVSVYGYYKPDKRALVMNIGTGGGTLVHELTHALAAFDFPAQPDWFNEGLASLYEQSHFDGQGDKVRISGLVNWRLPRLQEAIEKKELQTLEELITMRDFRGRMMGMNYAQARYFCMYLQDLGKLEAFYKEFRDNRHTDPTGLESAKKVIGKTAWSTLDADYQKWVAGLKRG